MKKIGIASLIFFAALGSVYSQGGVGINNAGTLPNGSAMLDVESTVKGVLIPRVQLTGSTDNTTILGGNVESLLVYNIATVSDITPGYYYWSVASASWLRLVSGAIVGGDEQDLTGASLTGTDLQIDIENGASANVDLMDLLDPTNPFSDSIANSLVVNNTFLQTIADSVDSDIDSVRLVGNILEIFENGQSVTTDLSIFLDADNWGTQAVISGIGFTGNGTTSSPLNFSEVDGVIGNEYNTSLTLLPNLDLNITDGGGTLTQNLDTILEIVKIKEEWIKGSLASTPDGDTVIYMSRADSIGVNVRAYTNGDFDVDGSYQIEGEDVLTIYPNNNIISINSLAIGVNALSSITGPNSHNLAVGKNALENLNGGNSNTAIGTNTLMSLSSGVNNLAIGFSAGGLLVTGSNMLAIGTSALSKTQSAQNTALGINSFRENTTGIGNLGVGQSAGEYNTIGVANTFLGHKSGLINTIYSHNTAVGNNAYSGVQSGTRNTALGSESFSFSPALGVFNVNSSAVDPITDQISIPGHGFTIGQNIALKFNTTGTLPGGITASTFYQFTVVNTNEVKSTSNISSSGTGIINISYNSLDGITNSTAIGFESNPTKSNQIMLGNLNVAEVKTSGVYISGANTYPDYVFENYFTGKSKINSEYQFMSLKQIEQFIKNNNHLPGVKSIKEVTNNEGKIEVNMTETTIKNLEKIEELYLHVIKLNKDKELLENKVDRLEGLLIETINK